MTPFQHTMLDPLRGYFAFNDRNDPEWMKAIYNAMTSEQKYALEVCKGMMKLDAPLLPQLERMRKRG